MCAALAPSRAWATVCDPVPAATFIQKLTELSVRGAGNPFARAWNCCAALESSRPNAPACAAEPMTVADPFPSRPSHALVFPDSKPSEKTTLVYPGTGVTAAEGVESDPVPTALIAATRNVYAVPFVRPVTLYIVFVEPVLIGVCALAPMYGVMR